MTNPPTQQLHSLKLTWHLKMDGWKTSFLLGWPIFRGELLVSGRVGDDKQALGFEIPKARQPQTKKPRALGRHWPKEEQINTSPLLGSHKKDLRSQNPTKFDTRWWLNHPFKKY